MRIWRILPAERSELFSPIGLRLLDELTGAPPMGRTDAVLDVQDGAGWRPTALQPVRTAGGVMIYPGLGRRAAAAGPAARYRVRITAELYRPLYRKTLDGLEVDVHPWNDATPPQVQTRHPQDVHLAPAPNYPFPPHLAVLRGRVVDGSGQPVADTEVRMLNHDWVLSDERGEFALPLRFAAHGVALPIDASHPRTGRVGQINVTLPADLGQSQTISIS